MLKQILLTTASLILVFCFGWYVDSILHDEIVFTLRLILYAIAVFLILGVGFFLFFWTLSIREKVLTAQANRKTAQRDSEVYHIVAKADEQVHIRDMNPKAAWRNATIDARVIANGKYQEPTQAEVRQWHIYHQLRSQPGIVRTIESPMLPAVTQLDLLSALDRVQRCLIVGASDTGKTTLLQWLVSRKLNTSKMVVIDPHAYPDKYPKNCVVIGLGRNYAEISKALSALVQLMTKRYDEIGKGLVAEMAHKRITILIDEWRAITSNLGKPASDAIKALLTESRKAAFSVFVASHSERAEPLGLKGEYDLKDGFTVVRLSIVNGQRQATIDNGNGEMPATLPGPYNGHVPQIVASLPLDSPLDLEPEPTATEAAILTLHAQGESKRAICEQVFGYVSSNKYPEIDAVLQKFGEK